WTLFSAPTPQTPPVKTVTVPPLSEMPAPQNRYQISEVRDQRSGNSEQLSGKPAPGIKPQPLPDPLPKTQAAKPQTVISAPKAPVQAKTVKAPAPVKQTPQSQTAAPPLGSVPDNYVPPSLEIRVGIARKVDSVALGTSQQAHLQDRSGRSLKVVGAGRPLTVSAGGANVLVNGNPYPGVLWLTPAQGSYLYVNDRWYRGRLLLAADNGALTVVSYVDLEHYLVSVVGSEMHANAPAEALKAQAIAARSYALVHMIRPASRWFDLGDSQRWQVYKGINSEYQTGYKAVGATGGQVLSYRGGVVESLYASTDAIVSSVHKGRGMSQLGAYDLARQGYTYQQILDRYYPGVSLARVILKQ
ncbi:MAG: SpoIID/LytB domain-containing protein, partial [Cyanobacteriota bacterium]